jgi:hypothetical protein
MRNNYINNLQFYRTVSQELGFYNINAKTWKDCQQSHLKYSHTHKHKHTHFHHPFFDYPHIKTLGHIMIVNRIIGEESSSNKKLNKIFYDDISSIHFDNSGTRFTSS